MDDEQKISEWNKIKSYKDIISGSAFDQRPKQIDILTTMRKHIKTTSPRDLGFQIALITEVLCMVMDEIDHIKLILSLQVKDSNNPPK